MDQREGSSSYTRSGDSSSMINPDPAIKFDAIVSSILFVLILVLVVLVLA